MNCKGQSGGKGQCDKINSKKTRLGWKICDQLFKKKKQKKREKGPKIKMESRVPETWSELASVVRSNPLSMSVVLERKPNYMALPLARCRSVGVCVCLH